MAVSHARDEQARAGWCSWPRPAPPASSFPRSSCPGPRRTWGRSGRTPTPRRTRAPRRTAPVRRSRRTPSAAGPRRSRIAWHDHTGASTTGSGAPRAATAGPAVTRRRGGTAVRRRDERGGAGWPRPACRPPRRAPRRAPRRRGRRACRRGWPPPARCRSDTPRSCRRAAWAFSWSGPSTDLARHHGDHVGGHPDVEAHPALGDLEHLGLEELPHGVEELGRRRRVVGPPSPHPGPASGSPCGAPADDDPDTGGSGSPEPALTAAAPAGPTPPRTRGDRWRPAPPTAPSRWCG